MKHPEMEKILDYYAIPGFLTDPGKFTDLLIGLPEDIGDLVECIQGALLHVFWADRYGRSLTDDEKKALNIRGIAEKLEILRQTDPRPLCIPRSIELRQVGNCRDFTLLLVTMLRFQGIPARARCGFATYFLANHFEDHWAAEYWSNQQRRWVMVDAQLDNLQTNALQIDFDPLDVPADRFILAGQAYQMCRAGEADPDSFGIFDMHGLDFIQGNVVRDFMALNKVEILPWDWGWGYLTETCFANLAFFDHLTALLAHGDEAFNEIRRTFDNDPSLQLR